MGSPLSAQGTLCPQAWAIYKGKYHEGTDKADPSTWKTRLRCALNKSTDFQEVPERSQLDISEPYKVYQLVSDGARDTGMSPATPAPAPGSGLMSSMPRRHHPSSPLLIPSGCPGAAFQMLFLLLARASLGFPCSPQRRTVALSPQLVRTSR